ncbi:MAG: AAA family ATPase [Bacteroidota bacterium]|nr:MAG: AAA family ATPase [Bacteroidota bacterium]
MPRKEIQEEITRLLNLLRREKEEDLKHYLRKMSSNSLTERRKEGVCWYPVRIEKTSYSQAEYPILRLSRNPSHGESHSFQPGKPVQLFSAQAQQDDEEAQVKGVVNMAGDHEMVVTLHANEIPDWAYDGKLGIQLLFDETSYREMEAGLKNLLTTTDKRIESLKQILLGEQEAYFSNESAAKVKELNESQNQALQLVLTACDVAIIHGPPGTGKTTTLVQAIRQTLQKETQVLVCAPSNAAVDLLCEKLLQENISVVRVGNPARITDQIMNSTLDAQITLHPQYKQLKTLRRQAEEYKNLGHKYKRTFGPEEREQRKLLLAEARQFKAEAEMLSGYIKNDIIEKTRVVACTLVGSTSAALKGKYFGTVFIDEAAQALEPACWLPILKSQRVIFAGDHCQLPPTIKSLSAAKEGLEVTLFEKAIERNKADTMLTEQYRMHESIMRFSGRHFYNDKLVANRQVANWLIFPDDQPLEFIDTAGCGFAEQTNPETKSAFNPEEMDLLFRHLSGYLTDLAHLRIAPHIYGVGIISPYKAQVNLMQESFSEQVNLSPELCKQISINTIDSFQGQERDVIYISLVRSNEKSEIGFLADIRRMNVAMTRARKKLVIVGDSATIGNHPFYSQLIDYVNETGAYKSAFEYLYP